MAKVMLVEDDNNLREIYEARLAAEGYDIVAAQDGEEALALAVKERPDLIIADVMMPKVSGFDMLDILRSTPETKHSKIIMMTALSQAEDKARAEKLGADRYLVKSQVTLEDVVKVASELLSDSSGLPPAAADTGASAASTPAADDANSSPSIPLPAPVDNTADATVAQPPVSAAPATPEPAVTPASIPVASEPTNSPAPAAATPASTPAAATPAPAEEKPVTAEAKSTETPADNLTNTTAEEEAQISQQIEEFIAGNPTLTSSAEPAKDQKEATTAPETPTVSATPTESKPTETPVTPEGFTEEVIGSDKPIETQPSSTPATAPTKTSIPVTVADDEPETPKPAETSQNDADTTMANVVEGLLGEKKDDTATTADSPATPETSAKTEESDAPQPAPKRGGERVIAPISDGKDTGPDLNELLAREEASAGSAPLSVNSVVSPDGTVVSNNNIATATPESFDATPGAVVQAPPAEGENSTQTSPADPNNIAL